MGAVDIYWLCPLVLALERLQPPIGNLKKCPEEPLNGTLNICLANPCQHILDEETLKDAGRRPRTCWYLLLVLDDF